MPSPTIVPVSVVVNLHNVSYNPATQQWSGSPSWTVPNTPVRAGTNTLQWTLRPASVPGGFAAAFPAASGIVFQAGWPGGTPARQPDGTYTATDNFATPPPTTADYPYSVTIVVTSQTDSSISTSFTLDPDVENQAGSVTHS